MALGAAAAGDGLERVPFGATEMPFSPRHSMDRTISRTATTTSSDCDIMGSSRILWLSYKLHCVTPPDALTYFSRPSSAEIYRELLLFVGRFSSHCHGVFLWILQSESKFD